MFASADRLVSARWRFPMSVAVLDQRRPSVGPVLA